MLVFLLGAVLASASCSTGSAGLPGPGEDGAHKKPLPGEGPEKRRVTKGGAAQASSSREDELADMPQEMSGSFLTCSKAEGAGDRGEDRYGCRVEKDRQMVDLAVYHPSWNFIDAATGAAFDTAGSEMRLQSGGSPWHAEFSLPRGQDKGRAARVSLIFKGGRQGSLTRPLLDIPLFQTLPQAKPFHIGDNSLLGGILGSCRLEMASMALVGPQLKVKLSVESARSAVTITLGGLCGVDYGNNTVTLRSSQGTVVASETMDPAARTFLFSTPVLDPGTYTLEVASGSGVFGRDNFVIRNILTSSAVRAARVKLVSDP